MLLGRCPAWEYKDHGDHRQVLQEALRTLLIQLRSGRLSVEDESQDTRHTHLNIFQGLTPPEQPYYAGHYRGEDFPCLANYEVFIPGDPAVGVACDAVEASVRGLEADMLNAVGALDASFALPDAVVPRDQKLYAAVVVASRIFTEFLTVHPYANGNGHIARFLVWLFLGRYGYWPTSWTIDPRPNASDYSTAISQHRRGRANALEKMILEAIV